MENSLLTIKNNVIYNPTTENTDKEKGKPNNISEKKQLFLTDTYKTYCTQLDKRQLSTRNIVDVAHKFTLKYGINIKVNGYTLNNTTHDQKFYTTYKNSHNQLKNTNQYNTQPNTQLKRNFKTIRDELLSLQKYTSYMYTDFHLHNSKPHVELLLKISDNFYIAPINYSQDKLKFTFECEADLLKMSNENLNTDDIPYIDIEKNETKICFSPNLSLFTTKNVLPNPQADHTSCGSLALIYTKELLKNNAKQLNEYCLKLEITKQNEQSYFFLPSPHVLRYSQSNTYNETLLAIVDNSHKLQNNKCTLSSTIQNYINQNAIYYFDSNNNRNLLTNDYFQNFKDKWIEKYNEMNTIRESMNNHSLNTNLYLAYKAYQLINLAHTVHDENYNSDSDNDSKNI